MSYIEKNGLTYETNYPYVSGNTGNNPIVLCKSVFTFVKVQTSFSGNAITESELKVAIENYGSVAVYVDASGFNDYASGVFDASWCAVKRPGFPHRAGSFLDGAFFRVARLRRFALFRWPVRFKINTNLRCS